MKSFITRDFRNHFRKLPNRAKIASRKNYKLWRTNRNHLSLDFKKVGKKHEVYSVRVGIGWRAIGVVKKGSIIWFWIGSHADYDKILRKF